MKQVLALVEQIDRTVRECDARNLPPLTSEPAAAALDLIRRAGLNVTPWQASLVRQLYTDPEFVRRLADPPAQSSRSSRWYLRPDPANPPPSALATHLAWDVVIVDEVEAWRQLGYERPPASARERLSIWPGEKESR